MCVSVTKFYFTAALKKKKKGLVFEKNEDGHTGNVPLNPSWLDKGIQSSFRVCQKINKLVRLL